MNNKGRSNQAIWESRYNRGEAVNRYPYDLIVSFVLRNFGSFDRKNIRILDYGCGGGNHCAFLAREGFDYYGIDYSRSAIKHTYETMNRMGITPDPAKLLCMNFKQTAFPDNFFDAVIDRQSLDQNMVEDLPVIVAEIFRILKPNGRYFGINFSDRHPALPFGKAMGKGDYHNFTCSPFVGIGARHFFNYTELISLFEKFIIVDMQVISSVSFIERQCGSEEIALYAQKPLL